MCVFSFKPNGKRLDTYLTCLVTMLYGSVHTTPPSIYATRGTMVSSPIHSPSFCPLGASVGQAMTRT